MKRILLLFFAAFAFISCENKVNNIERAAYYWKSGEWNKDPEDSIAKELQVKKIYVRFFDVEHDETMGNIPISKTNWNSYAGNPKYLDSLIIVPTVYLKNEVFIKSSKKEIDTLAANVGYLITKYEDEKFSASKPATEWQMDCDWTLKSRDNYFYFLRQVKKLSGKTISCTLRLYPYKYPGKMGVPPVDKAMLMCYNLLNPLESKSKNSILDVGELKLYFDKKRDYPLHLDVVLPTFSWMLLYQNNHFVHVLEADNSAVKSVLKPTKPLWFEVSKDTVIDGVYLRTGDQVKYESATPEMLAETIALLRENVVFDDHTTIAFFHLDKNLTHNYSHEALTRLYTDFSRE